MSGTPGPAPLRIHKHSSSQDFDPNPSNSPQPHRPLSELGSLAGRRNSVQYKVARRFGEDMAALGGSTRASPRAFWLGNLQENAKVKDSPAPSPRRTSLENLKKASRVQNNKLLKQHLHSPSPPSARPISMPPQSSGSPLKLESTPLKSSLTSPKKADPNSPPRALTTPPKNATLTSIMRGDNSTPIRASGPGKSSLLASYKVNGRSDIEDGTDGEDSTNTSPNRRKAVTFDDVPAQVVEYELITPVPSVDGSPSMSYDSHDSDDDDDEYDYDNTPVIEPDHWRDMPERVATPPRLGDPFRASPSPTGRPLPPLPGTPLSRSDSTSSNRPLPSIPFKSQIQSQQQISLHEKMQMMMQKSNAELHPDPNAHVEEERVFGTALGISFEEMTLNEGGDEEADDDRTMSPEPAQKETTLDGYEGGAGPYSKSMQFDKEFDFKRPKKISRDSIRRHVTRRDGSTSSIGSNESGETLSTVCDGNEEEEQSQFDGRKAIDISIVPVYDSARPASRYATRSPDAESEIIASEGSEYTGGDNDSRYSETDGDSDATPTAGTPRTISPIATPRAISPVATATNLPCPTENVPILSAPVPASPPTPPKEDEDPEKRLSLSLPEFTAEPNTDGLGLRAFMTPSPPPVTAAAEPTPVPSPEPIPVLTTTPALLPPISLREQQFDRPSTPENQHIEADEDLERTPESVIRHKIYHSDEDSEYDDEYYEETVDGEEADEPAQAESEADSSSRAETPQIVEPRRSPSPIPEDAATIRAPGGKLRTRPSATPADMAAMAAQRRQVSGDHTNAARMAAEAGSSDEEGSEEDEDEDEDEEDEEEEEDDREETASGPADAKGKTPMRKSSRKSLRMPTLDELNIDLNLEEEFDRVMETQKRGYLMRHSTRVIHASSRDIDEEPTARLQGHKRTQSWQVEPWKGSGRRRSTRNSLGQTGGQQDGTAPPVPGQADPISALHLAPPPTAAGMEGQKPPTPPENGERGRLFVKVIGVKDLTLPMPQREPTWFCLTLDNGLHCVTTSWLELAKNAPIGQEFELVVLNDLEFQLTLQTKLEKPPPKAIATPPIPPPQPQKMPKPKSTFSRVFISPKKRKELERQQREQQQLLQQQQAQAQAQAQAQKTQPEEPLSAWELLNGLVARDGSFARSYVCLKDFEQKAYGRPFITEINCFNEWAIEPGSLKTKRGNNPVRRPPYRIGKLEVQMLFVPKPPGMTDKDLPKSMAAAIRELKDAENMVARSWEGYLSQQGGDCPYWRRRYFKLIGAKLTAYHEVSRQPRATINLAKAIRLIDDRPSLTEPEIPTTNGKRRKSAFAEMEEGYMFVEEGFRIKFQNGETIDFYADNAEDKQGWMNVLGETIGGGQENRNWCELILNKEKMDREQATATQQRRMQQQQAQMQQFEKSYMPSTPGRNEPISSRTDLSDNRPSPPPKSTKRPMSGVPAGYPQGSIGSVNSAISLGR